MMAKAKRAKQSYPRFIVEHTGLNRKERRAHSARNQKNTRGFPKGHNAQSWCELMAQYWADIRSAAQA